MARPQKPESKLFGVLSSKAQVKLLSLLGSFVDEPFGQEAISALHGHLQRGRGSATLLDCSGPIHFNVPGMSKTEIEARALIAGAHLTAGWATMVDSIQGSSGDVARWIGQFGATQKIEHDPLRVQISYQRPEPLHLVDDVKLKATLHFDPSFSSIGWQSTDVRIDQNVRLVVEFKSPVKLDAAIKVVGQIEEITTLLSGWNVKIEQLECETKQADSGDLANRNTFGVVLPTPTQTVGKSHPFPLIPFEAVSAILPSVCASWLRERQRLSPLVAHWNVLRKAQHGVPLSYEFLALCSVIDAAEKLHEGIQDDRRAFVARCETFLARTLPPSLRPSDIGDFSARVRDTRNWLTHYTDEYRQKAMDNLGQVNACEVLRLALRLELMRYSGISSETAVSMFHGAHMSDMKAVVGERKWFYLDYRGEQAVEAPRG